jgi:3,4-dihydroxy 2-butanone 4-phosphate synthase/GTP cyclohydrolase II
MNLKMVSKGYTKSEQLIQGEKVFLPTKIGKFKLIPFQEKESGLEHIVLIKGDPNANDVVLTRIHSACATGDLFGSLRCDCGDQLNKSMELIQNEGLGVIIYLQQEGRGIGLMNKIRAYKLQEAGMDTVDANLHLGFAPDERDYAIGAEILKALGIVKLRLLTNNPEKVEGLESNGIKVVKREPIIIEPNKYSEWYLKIKKTRMGHLLTKQKAS